MDGIEGVDATALPSRNSVAAMPLYGSTIFLSAFLLFQVQPVIGKAILPWFGGSAAVWSTCLLFFQLLLLLGYLYAHWTSKYLAPKRQALLHLSLLALSVGSLPITPGAHWKPTGGEDPTWLILGLMLATIGLPYFLLSTSGPLLQAWFARERAGTVPYRLFALSNFGSMLGLLSYPIVFEPGLTIPEMSIAWSAAYVIFAMPCALLAMRGLRVNRTVFVHAGTPSASSRSQLLLWAVLAACPTVLLMGVTSHVTQNVAPVPFLWVLPLALYLLSFILCFEGGHWYRRKWFLPVFVAWLAVMNIDLIRPLTNHGVWIPVALYCAGLFVSCMLCHGELARMKPQAGHLTSFYLMIALGGAAGGIFVAILAPRLFNNNYELPAAAIATALVVATIVHRDGTDAHRRAPATLKWTMAMAITIALITIFAVIGMATQNSMHHLLARNFYGTLRIDDEFRDGHWERHLVHGMILHGSQYLDMARRRWPMTYYGDNGGAGKAVLATRRADEAQRVGVIGLGTGTMAAYGRSGDYYRFYEINPLVEILARSEFTFLTDSPAIVQTVLGDARQSLEREAPQQFDVLVVDAFSGDAIPVHLLTREAFALYFRHLRPGGILAVHISNRNLDLAPVVRHASDFFGKVSRVVDAKDEKTLGLMGSTWMLVSDDDRVFKSDQFTGCIKMPAPATSIRPWTDDYSSIYAILK